MKATRSVRVIILAAIFLGVALFFSIRLMQMQVVEGEDYKNKVNQGSSRTQVIKAARGEIFDRNGNPLAINTTSYDIVFDRAFLPSSKQNDVILSLIRLMQENGQEWIDNLPISLAAPFEFTGTNPLAVDRLKKQVDVNPFATADDVMYWLKKIYNLEDYNDQEARLIAGVRYEMVQKGYNISVPYTFAKGVTTEVAGKIKERSYEWPGVDVQAGSIRSYPNGTVAPHIIGSMGALYAEEYEKYMDKGYSMDDVVGKEGIELAFESELRGTNGTRRLTLNSSGYVVDDQEEITPIPGNSIRLTLDMELQQYIQDSLRKRIETLNENAKEGYGKEADAGSVAVVNVKTGEILALVSYPTYDLNTYRKNYEELAADPTNPLWNRALFGNYSPGSTFKPAVAVGALTEGVVGVHETVDCRLTYTRFHDYQPSCMYYHGPINVYDALRHSCNVYFFEVGYRLGIAKMNQYAQALGLGVATGVELPETKGRLSSPEFSKSMGGIWTEGNVIQAAIGQLDTVASPLQLANYTATIANRGKRMDLTLIHQITSYDGSKVVKSSQPNIANTMDEVPDEVWDAVVGGMVKASRQGTGSSFFGNYPIDVASKTGTPQVSGDKLNSVFVAFAPAEDPEIAVAVVIEKGAHGSNGGPVAKDIMDFYFYKDEVLARQQQEASGQAEEGASSSSSQTKQ